MSELAPSALVVAIHEALEECAIPHAFGGAIALAYMTTDPRGTSDIDVNVFMPAARAGPALDALPSGVRIPEGAADRIARDGQIRLFWEETPVDLFFNNLPIHDEAARHARVVPFSGIELPILGPVELVVFKAMFNRTQDWADIENVIAAGELDLGAVREKLVELIGTDDERYARLDEAVRLAEGR